MQEQQHSSPSDPGRKTYWDVQDVFSQRAVPARCFVHRDYSMGLHAHEFIEINIVLRGKGQHAMQDETFLVTEGNVFVIPPDVQHGYGESEGLDVYHVLVHPTFVSEHEFELRALPGFVLFFTVEPYFRKNTAFRYALELPKPRVQEVRTVLEWLERQQDSNTPGNVFGMTCLLKYLLALLCNTYVEQYPSENTLPKTPSQMDAIRAAMDRMEQDYARKLTLNDLADTAHLQKNYFCRLFREATGVTPMAYLNQVRVQNARRLLRSTDLSLTEIALRTGFWDSSHFSRTFRRIAGSPPSQLRK